MNIVYVLFCPYGYAVIQISLTMSFLFGSQQDMAVKTKQHGQANRKLS